MTAPIGELITQDDVLLDVDAATREDLLSRAAAFMAARHGLSAPAVRDALTARERLGSTALGHGVALPHARMQGLRKPVAAFLRTRAPIAYDAPDGRPVSQFLVLLVPAEAREHHLELMGCAACQFADRDFRVRLKSAANSSAVADLFDYLPDAPA